MAPPVTVVTVQEASWKPALLTWGQTGSHTLVPRCQLVLEVSPTELGPNSHLPLFKVETNPPWAVTSLPHSDFRGHSHFLPSFPAGDPVVILGTQSMSLNSPLVLNKASFVLYITFSLSPGHPSSTLKKSQDAIYTSVSEIKERFCKTHCMAVGCLLPIGLSWCC